MTINHDEIKSDWLTLPDLNNPVEFEVKTDPVKEMRLNAENKQYPVFVFSVKDNEGEVKKLSVFRSVYRDMVLQVEKKRGLKQHTLESLIGTKWKWIAKADDNEGKVYEMELVKDA